MPATRASRATAATSRRLTELRTRLREKERALSALARRLQDFESGTAMVAMGRRLLLAEAQAARATELESRLLALEARQGPLRAERARLQRELAEIRAERDALERFWLAADAGEGVCVGDCRTCEDRLKGRCVLCVGGRTPLLPQYRQLAERLGVRLLHHDGGREEALSRLPELLEASDAVICPHGEVGYLAYYQLKKHCRQRQKPCVLTRNPGIAGFAAALDRIAQGRADIEAQT